MSDFALPGRQRRSQRTSETGIGVRTAISCRGAASGDRSAILCSGDHGLGAIVLLRVRDLFQACAAADVR